MHSPKYLPALALTGLVAGTIGGIVWSKNLDSQRKHEFLVGRDTSLLTNLAMSLYDSASEPTFDLANAAPMVPLRLIDESTVRVNPDRALWLAQDWGSVKRNDTAMVAGYAQPKGSSERVDIVIIYGSGAVESGRLSIKDFNTRAPWYPQGIPVKASK